jgi:hypothetical protein
VRRLVVLVEEPSARALLQGLLPRLLPDGWEVHYLVFEGKQDLERSVARRLRGWLAPDSRFVVLRDQDAGDCRVVKRGLAARVEASGREALVRVACHELEAWIAGDLRALGKAYKLPSVERAADRARFRQPDELAQPVEALRGLVPGYQKIDGARRVGPLLSLEGNRSPSFRAFCDGIRRLVAEV